MLDAPIAIIFENKDAQILDIRADWVKRLPLDQACGEKFNDEVVKTIVYGPANSS